MLGKKLKSVTIAIALKLGLICEEKAAEADEVVTQDNGEHPTLTLLIDQGYLDKVQAAKLEAEREKDHPMEQLKETAKLARHAVRKAVPNGAR